MCIKEIATVPISLLSKLIRITITVRDMVTGDTLPVIVTTAQPPPLELHPGTNTFDEGTKPQTPNPKPQTPTRDAGHLTVTLDNVPVDENVCCVAEIADASSPSPSLLFWCCLPIYEKNNPLPTPKASRPPTSASVKEITKAAALSRRPLLLLKSASSR